MNAILWEILEQNLTEAELDWLRGKDATRPMDLMTAFVAAPRFLSKQIVQSDVSHTLELSQQLPGFSITGWNLVRLSRVWLLSCLDASDRDTYIRHVETLFDTAEMNELVALYSALPLLAYPEQWLFRATEAVRSNMGVVFDALALQNPYPARYFGELAWNQLVLKTIFNDKPIHLIVGLEERTNEKLARTLSDFAHERWAAGRSVAPEVWRLVSKFLDEALLEDIKYLFASDNSHNQEAAALVCFHANYPPAQALLAQYPELEKSVQQKKLSWTDLEFNDLNTYVSKP